MFSKNPMGLSPKPQWVYNRVALSEIFLQQVTPRSLQRLVRRRSESLRDWRDFRARLVQGVELKPGF